LLKCLLDIQDNVVCPIKLLLIHALRLGRVQGKSIDEVLSKARIRPNKQIVWTDDQAPIFYAITSSGAGLLVDKPASNQQAKHFVAQAGQLCGVLGSIITHDIRRGSARDTAQIKSGINGLATSAVAATLGHTHQSHQRAVTAAYVGAIDDDVWAKRVNLKYEDPFGLRVAAQPPQRSQD
jgi:integrase